MLVAVLLQAAIGGAQVTTITPSGLGTTVSPPAPGGITYEITGGSRGGTNLFHSFGQFSVGAGDRAVFSNTTPSLTTRNIFSRVTGGTGSSIYGGIDTLSYPGANFFLLNPAGVILGPGALLSVSGSVHISTADYVGFADGERFYAEPAAGNVLSAANPTAFGFLTPSPAAISIDGSLLQVSDRQTLSIVGGAIQVLGSWLVAPSGRIHIASVGTPGEVTMPDLGVTSFTRLERVDVAQGSLVDTSGDPGGTVVIRGGRLVIDNSTVQVATGDLTGAAIGIDIRATEAVQLGNGALLTTQSLGFGRGGDITVAAPLLTLDQGALVHSFTSGLGPGGRVLVATGIGTLSGTGTEILSLSGGDGEFSAADISIAARTLRLTDGARISSGTFRPRQRQIGGGGNVTVDASESIVISSGSAISTLALFEDVGETSVITPSLTLDDGFINTGTLESGAAASIVVKTGNLFLTRGGQITSRSEQDGSGGNVTVMATDAISIAGRSSSDPSRPEPRSGIFSIAGGAGSGGEVAVSAPTLTMDAGGAISVAASEPGRAGNVSLNATNVRLSGGARIDSGTVGVGPGGSVTVNAVGSLVMTAPETGLFSTTSSSGAAGTIGVAAPDISLTAGARIESGTSGTGKGGSIAITASSATLAGRDTGFFSTTASDGTTAGAAGSITLAASTLTMSDGASISVAANGTGNAGNIAVSANSMSLASSARVDSSTSGAGRGGDISIIADRVELTSGAAISATSTGAPDAFAGNINIVFGDRLLMKDSRITTDSTLADGGNISVTASGSLLHLIDSSVTTSVHSGSGRGGNITVGSALNPLDFVLLERSQIRADAFTGPGGSVRIFADFYLASDSIVSASSAFSAPGTVGIEAQISDIGGRLTELSEAVLRDIMLLPASCRARVSTGNFSSFVVTGREGVPPEPSGFLQSPLLSDDAPGWRFGNGQEHDDVSLKLAHIAIPRKCSR